LNAHKEHIMHTLSAPRSLSAHLRRLAALAALAASAGAHAGGVQWSVNVDLPAAPMGRVVTAVSNAPAPVVVYRGEPVYERAPVYVGRQVVYTQPQPVYVQPRPVYQRPVRVVYAPAPVVVVNAPHHVHHRGHHHGWGHVRHHQEARAEVWQGGGGGRRMVVPNQGRVDEGRGGRDDRDGDQRGGLRHHH
jgi:hypothetical protein